MTFKYGDRVVMLRHADWKNDATGTIVSVRGVRMRLADGSEDCWYWIRFGEAQRDWTDEAHERRLEYWKSTVLGRYLRLLDA